MRCGKCLRTRENFEMSRNVLLCERALTGRKSYPRPPAGTQKRWPQVAGPSSYRGSLENSAAGRKRVVEAAGGHLERAQGPGRRFSTSSLHTLKSEPKISKQNWKRQRPARRHSVPLLLVFRRQPACSRSRGRARAARRSPGLRDLGQRWRTGRRTRGDRHRSAATTPRPRTGTTPRQRLIMEKTND